MRNLYNSYLTDEDYEDYMTEHLCWGLVYGMSGDYYLVGMKYDDRILFRVTYDIGISIETHCFEWHPEACNKNGAPVFSEDFMHSCIAGSLMHYDDRYDDFCAECRGLAATMVFMERPSIEE